MQKALSSSFKKLPKWWVGLLPIIGWTAVFNPSMIKRSPQPLLFYVFIVLLQIIISRWVIISFIKIAAI